MQNKLFSKQIYLRNKSDFRRKYQPQQNYEVEVFDNEPSYELEERKCKVPSPYYNDRVNYIVPKARKPVSEITHPFLRQSNKLNESVQLKDREMLGDIWIAQAELKKTLKKEEEHRKEVEDIMDDIRVERERREIAEQYRREKLQDKWKSRDLELLNNQLSEAKRRLNSEKYAYKYYMANKFNRSLNKNKNYSCSRTSDMLWHCIGDDFKYDIENQIGSLRWKVKKKYDNMRDQILNAKWEVRRQRKNYFGSNNSNYLRNNRTCKLTNMSFDDLERTCNNAIIDSYGGINPLKTKVRNVKGELPTVSTYLPINMKESDMELEEYLPASTPTIEYNRIPRYPEISSRMSYNKFGY